MARKKEVSSEKPVKPVKTTPRVKAAPAVKKSVATAKATISSTNSVTTINPEERHKMIAQTAYFRAEARGFVGGDPLEDWIQAEKEVDKYL